MLVWGALMVGSPSKAPNSWWPFKHANTVLECII
jgi:hypothetical protein